MEYIIKRLPEDVGALKLSGAFDPAKLKEPYRSLSEAVIGDYPWGGEYRPFAAARVGWNAKGLHVLMYAREESIRADETKIGGRVCEDSCLEFFFEPFPDEDARYLNFESNPMAVLHIGIGEGRENRRKWYQLFDGANPTHSEHEDGWWAVSYTISADFIGECFVGRVLRPGLSMKGNFYTCDESLHPHFGTHFPVAAARPDFHRPECFRAMILA